MIATETHAGFAASDGWSVRPENMKLKPNDIITVESEDGILHEMIVKSSDETAQTVTGEVANWKSNLSGYHQAVKTITVPMRLISWVGHRRLQ